jgi:AcrR family transcriptional regulator
MGAKKSNRVTKDQWLSKALDILEADGISGVRIEEIARQLDTSRSGFYWHFKNRDALLKNMLDYWEHESTAVVTNNPELNEGPAEKRLERVIRMIIDYELNKLDATIFVWSKKSPIAKRAIKRVHKMRLEFISSLFSELGFKGNELEMRTQLFVCYHSLEYVFFSNQPKSKRDSLLKLRLRLLTQN